MKSKPGPFQILMVEDDNMDAYLTEKYLIKAQIPFHMHRVKNGVEALDFLKKKEPFEKSPRPDLVLLDLNLPLVNGEEILAAVKTTPDLQDIPVIVVTGQEKRTDLQDSFNLPENSVFTKWIFMKDFVSVVQAVKDICQEKLS